MIVCIYIGVYICMYIYMNVSETFQIDSIVTEKKLAPYTA